MKPSAFIADYLRLRLSEMQISVLDTVLQVSGAQTTTPDLVFIDPPTPTTAAPAREEPKPAGPRLVQTSDSSRGDYTWEERTEQTGHRKTRLTAKGEAYVRKAHAEKVKVETVALEMRVSVGMVYRLAAELGLSWSAGRPSRITDKTRANLLEFLMEPSVDVDKMSERDWIQTALRFKMSTACARTIWVNFKRRVAQ